MKQLTIMTGNNKNLQPELVEQINLEIGQMYAVVGNTGAGKSRLIKDIEQLAQGDTVTKRRILIDGTEGKECDNLIAHLSQNMRFVLDVTVLKFLTLHSKCRNIAIDPKKILECANTITAEPIQLEDALNLLSGGQTRALMIADLALICDSPIVLIDEIENAGIDKEVALNLLLQQNKLILAVTHDPHTALMATGRIIMEHGGITSVIPTSNQEKELYEKLHTEYIRQKSLQKLLRQGEELQWIE